MRYILDLISKIENKRQEMYEYSLKFGLSSKKTIQCSKELDDLLNQYESTKKSSSRYNYS